MRVFRISDDRSIISLARGLRLQKQENWKGNMRVFRISDDFSIISVARSLHLQKQENWKGI